jgi:Lon protease-like protein
MGVAQAFPIFVFPLPQLVFYPGTIKPLNVFEPRYIRMINHAVATDTLIALANTDPARIELEQDFGLLHIRRIAGVGRPVILEERSDGILLVAIEGIGKVRLINLLASNEPYLKCESIWVNERTQVKKENYFLMNRISKDLQKWLAATLGNDERLQSFLKQIYDPIDKVNYFCSLMIQDSEAQQQLLEIDDINDKLSALSLLLQNQKTAQSDYLVPH